MINKPKLDLDNPGPWGSAGSLSKTRRDVEVVCSAVDLLKEQLVSQTLDPQSVLAHVKKIKACLDVLEAHANAPTKYN